MAKATPTLIFSHWYNSIENFHTSPKQFYGQVEDAVAKRQVPDVKLFRVDWREGGILSAKREYLRVRRKKLVFDICGAPFGTGFFVSWWLGELPSGFLAFLVGIPFIGVFFAWLITRFIRPETYYKLDTANMFQQAIHASVLQVVDEVTSAKGLRALSELERKPILREFSRR